MISNSIKMVSPAIIPPPKISLHTIGLKYKTDKSYLHNYLDFYETYLNQYKNEKIRLLEIGIGNGASLKMWEEYFPNAEIVGVDTDKKCLKHIYTSARVKTLIGDQANRTFLNNIQGEFDIIIDDGGHTMIQQMVSFGCLFKKLKKEGIYIIENLHTSFIPAYGGNASNTSTVLSELHNLNVNKKVDSKYLLADEKKYIEENVREIIFKGYSATSIDKENITSVIKRSINFIFTPISTPLIEDKSEKLIAPKIEFKKPNNIITLSPNKITEPLKDINIFFHICCINNHSQVTNEIIDEIIKCGLYDKTKKIFYSALGEMDSKLRERIYTLKKFELIHLNYDVNEVEYPTLINLYRFSKKNNSYILYLHTKGVSLPKDDFRQNWRKRLMQKVLTEYKTCTSFLNEGCDISGCGWKENAITEKKMDYNIGEHEHFSGNFWWANTDFIKKLPNIYDIKESHLKFKKSDFLKYRVQCEFWIGMLKNIRVGVNGELNKEYSTKKYYETPASIPSIGIGITTRNRKNILRFILNKFKAYKIGRIVVVDDNSEEKLETSEINGEFEYYYNETRLGIAKSKNKCLSLLNKEDYVFLFDDDCFPICDKWWEPWINCKENHLIWTIKEKSKIIKENNDTYWWDGCLGVCLFFTRECLNAIGGFDNRFKAWGGEHHELTTRIFKAGLIKHRCISPKKLGIWAFDAQGDYNDFKWNHTSSVSEEEKKICAAEIPHILTEIANDHTIKR